MSMQGIYIGKRLISNTELPLFAPDIGTFFNQDMGRAETIIKKLVLAGVELVKGEILHTAEIALKSDHTDAYFCPSKGVIKENYRQIIERKVVPLENYAKLFNLCKQYQLPFLVSVYDDKGARFALEQGAVALKIASSNVTHYPLISYVASLGLPMIIDTGRANIDEIARALGWAKAAGAKDVIIEHSPKAPPAPVSEQNLKFMCSLANMFGVPVGLSDHHAGTEMLLSATALGASLLEKGVFLDDQPMDQDVAHGMPVSQVAKLLKQIKLIHEGLGSGLPNYFNHGHPARMGWIARRDLPIGHIIRLEDLTYAFPGVGVKVEETPLALGWRLVQDKQAGEVIAWQDLKAGN
ncbi:MAG: N-acetylneuraminate synthase family protein [Methyloprofundus sp.]|nr:N-acetylneuraminate synthase family protein [Methyloprofundus sp.]